MQPIQFHLMTISYNWLSRYIPEKIAPEKLSKILTSIGLEVESLHHYSSIKGDLQGLVVGEVLTCEKHENADKLKVTTVDTGNGAPVQIVCGAANVAAGQKVVVAPVNTILHPTTGDSFTIKKAKIRGVESEGMLCAEDEIGLGQSHDGIMVLPADTKVGTAVDSLYKNYEDEIFEIGLTPNRMDAMSHLGVARDVLAYINHHEKKTLQLQLPAIENFVVDKTPAPVKINIENEAACRRYAGVTIEGITVEESPAWLQNSLRAIGVQPINNIVDITNYVLHDTGQPLHAFDTDKIKGNTINVKTLAAGTSFKSLDGKERKLFENDLMICDGDNTPMCMAGVYGGADSGINSGTKDIFLESACFSPSFIRASSLKHNLRTDAAARFEKGIDISVVLNVLKQATSLILQIAGGKIKGGFTDIYPVGAEKTVVRLKYHYLKKLSGKNYHGDAVKNILTRLGFTILKDDIDELTLAVPLSKPDISIPADIVEEILRIDGLDNIEIPTAITISPSINANAAGLKLKQKVAGHLTGMGFHEIFTNSITDSKYYTEEELKTSVKMLNSLSADLNIMRPQMLQTGLEVVAYNKNRKNNDLLLFENGKTYTQQNGKYFEQKHLCLYLSGNILKAGWQQKEKSSDFYYLKTMCNQLLQICGLKNIEWKNLESEANMDNASGIWYNDTLVGYLGETSKIELNKFGIKDPVFFADLLWDKILNFQLQSNITYKEISRLPAMERDLALIVDSKLTFDKIESSIKKANAEFLTNIKLFDVFESDKLGKDKKSMAVSFTFLNEEKTLTDKETDAMVAKILKQLHADVGAEIRQ